MNVEVSVICNAYNHEKYIAQALNGFLMQKTNFKFEILIHDDASTDKTAEIIKEYENKYPDIIKPIYELENQYSKGNGNLFRIQADRINGRYVAICEGDDFWIDENKLQIQYDIMEKFPEINICAHSVKIVNEDASKIKAVMRPKKKDEIIPVEDVIKGGGGFVGTNSLFIRTNTYKNPPNFRKNFLLDYTLQIASSLPNGMYYIDKELSAYRWASVSSMTKSWSRNRDLKVSVNNKIINMLNELDEETNYKYTDVIKEAVFMYEYEMLQYDRDYKKMIKHPYFNKNSLIAKLKVYIKKIINYKK